jgi:tetratricopeptide (TPR) repeat protein
VSIDVQALWNYDRPDESEARFRRALETATGDDALILRTQIARTFGLRERCDEAHAELDAIADQLPAAGPEPRARARLERGRAFRTAGHPAAARPCFEEAFAIADAAKLEWLAADALHMLPLVETGIEAQIAGARRLLDYAGSATDPKARNWRGTGLHNLGVALNEAGRHEEALAVLEEALAFREQRSDVKRIRIARWMVAHTLRRLGRIDDALGLQLALAADGEAAGEADAHVFEELALLYEAKDDGAKAAHFREKQRSASAS